MADDRNILLIDDDEDTFFIVRRLLSGAGNYVVDWADSFERGRDRICNGNYDAALIDYRLGARDGLELLDEAVEAHVATPMILLTGQGCRDIDLDAMHRGAADYLAKDQLQGEALDRSIRYAIERQHLTADLRRHAAELSSRADELQRVNENLEQFVWAASHDLQTPLRTITYRLQYLRSLHGPDLNGSDSIDCAADAALRMSRLLHELLDYIRSASIDLSKSSVDCNELVREVVQRFSGRGDLSTPEVEYCDLPTIEVSHNLIAQVFQNLFQNSISHSTKAQVHISVSAEKNERMWTFHIEDDGAGITPENTDRIFEPFRRGAQSTGSGIGLALCRRIIERHGGRMWCESQPGRGAIFYFSIPDPCKAVGRGVTSCESVAK